jgi:formate hydrogenlyase transcriptional activator
LSEGDAFSLDETSFRSEKTRHRTQTVALNGALLQQEKQLIETALAQSRGRVSGPNGAASKLGIPSRTLDSKIKRLKINKSRFKDPP